MIRAEQALREAQRQGRNSFVEYKPSEERVKAHRRSLDIGQQALAALKGNGLRLAFQPIIDAKTRNVVLFEALVRMTNEKGEFIPAGLFIPVVEQLGMANIVDQRVLDMAIEAMEADPTLHLAVNISRPYRIATRLAKYFAPEATDEARCRPPPDHRDYRNRRHSGY